MFFPNNMGRWQAEGEALEKQLCLRDFLWSNILTLVAENKDDDLRAGYERYKKVGGKPIGFNLVRDGQRNTPALLAASFGHTQIVQYLIAEGEADIEAVNNLGRKLIHNSALGGSIELLTLLAEHDSSLFEKTANHSYLGVHTALHCAAQGGRWEVIKWLVDQGHDLKQPDSNGRTAMHYAAMGGHFALIQSLATAGLDIEATCNDGGSLLHYAALGGQKRLITQLLLQNFKPQTRNAQGATLIHYAAMGGHEDLIAFLEQGGLDPFEKDSFGRTILHYAAMGGHDKLIDRLSSKDHDLSARDINGATVLHLAAQGGRILDIGIATRLYYRLNANDNRGRTPMHYAADALQHYAIVLLLDAGYKLDDKDNEGSTPLHLLEKQAGRQDVIIFLEELEELNKIKPGHTISLLLKLFEPSILKRYVKYRNNTAPIYSHKNTFLANQNQEIDTEALKIYEKKHKYLRGIDQKLADAQKDFDHIERIYNELRISTSEDTALFRLKILREAKALSGHIVGLKEGLRQLGDKHRMTKIEVEIFIFRTSQLLKKIYLDPVIKDNWVRIRIWNSGVFEKTDEQAGPSSRQYAPTSSTGVSLLALKNMFHAWMYPNATVPNDINVGHVSIETAKGYMSFWPKELMRAKSVHEVTRGRFATMHNLVDDERAEGPDQSDANILDSNKSLRSADMTFVLYTLDAEKINKYCEEICRSITTNELQFSLLGSRNKKVAQDQLERLLNCVTLSYNLLLKGGLKDLVHHPEQTYPVNQVLDPYWMQCLMKMAVTADADITNRDAHCAPTEDLNVAPFSHPELAPTNQLIDRYRVTRPYSSEQVALSLNEELYVINERRNISTFLDVQGRRIVLPNTIVAEYFEKIPRIETKIHSPIMGKK
jgi:ankyrin repeat protein